jgi:allantoate deiminase
MSKVLASIVVERLNALGQISDEADRLTRTFCSPAMQRANNLVGSWMRQAGMTVRQDAIGNLIGRYGGESPESGVHSPKLGAARRKTLLLGSHLDTVRDAGKFDGPLGVLTAMACVQHLRETKTELPFAIEVVGFCDEEGVRYQSTYLGSKVLAGTFNRADLERKDANGITMADAIREFGGNPAQLGRAKFNRKNLLGYVEVHIEQGPVLEKENLSVGVVTAIAGQTRAEIRFRGTAGHAGTVPMKMRRDALCAASEFICAVESHAKRINGLVATVGKISALPGTTNVIPGQVVLSLDVRHAIDGSRAKAWSHFAQTARAIVRARGIGCEIQISHEAPSVQCDSDLSGELTRSVKRCQGHCISLPSGAGHDAAAMATITRVAMLFVRCKGGISHNPAESVALKDIRAAVEVMNDFLVQLATTCV